MPRPVYAQSVTNLSQISLATDMVFSDGATLELATIRKRGQRIHGRVDGGRLT